MPYLSLADYGVSYIQRRVVPACIGGVVAAGRLDFHNGSGGARWGQGRDKQKVAGAEFRFVGYVHELSTVSG